MPNRSTGRDYPLAPTPVVSDNTRVYTAPKDVTPAPQPKYTNVATDVKYYRKGKSYSKQDSLDYKKGFNEGLSKEYPSSKSGAVISGFVEGMSAPPPKKKFLNKK